MGFIEELQKKLIKSQKEVYYDKGSYQNAADISDAIKKGKTVEETLDDVDYIVNKKNTSVSYVFALDFSNANPDLIDHFRTETEIEDINGEAQTIIVDAIDDTIRIDASKNDRGEIEYRCFNRRGNELNFNSREELCKYINDRGGFSKDIISLQDKENIITDILRETDTFADKIKAIKLVAPYYNENGGEIYLPLRYSERTNMLHEVSKEDYLKNPRNVRTAEQQFMRITFNKEGTQNLAIGFMGNPKGNIEFVPSLSLGHIQENSDEKVLKSIEATVKQLESANYWKDSNLIDIAKEKLDEVRVGFVPDSTNRDSVAHNGTNIAGFYDYDIAKEHFGNMQITGLALNAITLSDHYIAELVNDAVKDIKSLAKMTGESPYGLSAIVDTSSYAHKGKNPLVTVEMSHVVAYDFGNLENNEPGKLSFESEKDMQQYNEFSLFMQLTSKYEENFKKEGRPVPLYDDYLRQKKEEDRRVSEQEAKMNQFNTVPVKLQRNEPEIGLTLNRYIQSELEARRILENVDPRSVGAKNWKEAASYNIGVFTQYEKDCESYTISFNGKKFEDIQIKKTDSERVQNYRDKSGQTESLPFLLEGNSIFKEFAKEFINDATLTGIKSLPGTSHVYNNVYNKEEILSDNTSENQKINILTIRPDKNSEPAKVCIVKKDGNYELRGTQLDEKNNPTINMAHKIECDIDYVATQLANNKVITETYFISNDNGERITGNYKEAAAMTAKALAKSETLDKAQGILKKAFSWVKAQQAKTNKKEIEFKAHSAKRVAMYTVELLEGKKTSAELEQKYAGEALRDLKAMAIDNKQFRNLNISQGDLSFQLVSDKRGKLAVVNMEGQTRVLNQKEEKEIAMEILKIKSNAIIDRVSSEIRDTSNSLRETISLIFNKENDLMQTNGMQKFGQIKEDIVSDLGKYEMKPGSKKDISAILKDAERKVENQSKNNRSVDGPDR